MFLINLKTFANSLGNGEHTVSLGIFVENNAKDGVIVLQDT